jgi:hypothetical protein
VLVKRYRSAVTVAVVFAAVLGGATPALAAPPTTIREPIDLVFVDEDLTNQCGFEVAGRIIGTRTTRTFDHPGTGVQEISNVNAAVTFSANGNTVRTRDVGADVTRLLPDGTLVLSVIGQVPLNFKGVAKIDLAAGEVIFEPQRQIDLDAICAALDS